MEHFLQPTRFTKVKVNITKRFLSPVNAVLFSGLFNDVINISDYIVSNDGTINGRKWSWPDLNNSSSLEQLQKTVQTATL
jgi:hypothetical protein